MMREWLLRHDGCIAIVMVIVVILVFSFIPAPHLLKNKLIVTTQFPDTIQRVLPSVVHIMCDRWQASGVALTEDIIVTARHVIDGLNYTITLSNGDQIKGVQAISHKNYDVGFIKIGKTHWPCGKPILTPAKFGSVKDCVLGQPVFIIGSPYGKINYNNVTLGIISGLDIDWDSLSRYGDPYGWEVAFTSDAGAHPGNSGGPVFTMDGVVRGLLVGALSPALNCSMPCDLFLSDIENIKLMFAFEKYSVEKKKRPFNDGMEWR